jgi:hypothetical protein
MCFLLLKILSRQPGTNVTILKVFSALKIGVKWAILIQITADFVLQKLVKVAKYV